jgi:hypothetical protein
MTHLLYAIEFCSVTAGFFWILMLILNGEVWPLPPPEKGKEGERILLGIVLMLCYLEIFGVI